MTSRTLVLAAIGAACAALAPAIHAQCAPPSAAAARAQQPAAAGAARPTPAVGMAPTPKSQLLEIWQIDLDPSGQAFSFGQPRLDGDAYVFTAWPERQTVRLSKSKVKKLTQRTKDINQMSVWVVELAPTGRMTAREQPQLKGKSYIFHTRRDGKLMSLRQEDVKSIQRATGLAAFRIDQEERGASLNANLPMEGGGTVTVINPQPEPAAQAPADNSDPGNWRYEGQPGVSDAYAPPSAVVASPGDVPKAAPTPAPQPPH
jgi:hypothetical protein